MGEEKKEGKLPVRTLHEFLFEISQEWDKFRSGSLLSIIISAMLIALLLPRLLIFQVRRGELIDTLITLGIIVALIYNTYIAWRQHDFYRKWEKRIGLLLHTEEELLGPEE